MKKSIIILLISIFFIGYFPISCIEALPAEDAPHFYAVRIDKTGEILGDGDTISVTCKLAKCESVVDDCICWINAYDSNISFPLHYNKATDCYEGSYTFGETYDNPQRTCYIMMIESYNHKITTYYNDDVHPFGLHEFYYCNQCKEGVHYPVIDEPQEATCTTEGTSEGSHCSFCSAVIKVRETIPAKGHIWDNGKVMKEATCKETGIKAYTCTICKESKNETIDLLLSHIPGPEATATEDQICTSCGEVLTKATGENQSGESLTETADQPTMSTTQPTETAPLPAAPATQPNEPASQPTVPTPQTTKPSNGEDPSAPTITPTEPDNTGEESVRTWIFVAVVGTLIFGASATTGIILRKKRH